MNWANMNSPHQTNAFNDFVHILPHCAVMLVLDTSHSMYKGTALADLHRSLGNFLTALGREGVNGATVDVAAIGMGDDLRVLEDFHPLAESGLGNLRIRPKGNTPLGGALRLALNGLDAKTHSYELAGYVQQQPQLIILSDGVSTDDFRAEAAEIQARVTAGRLGVRAIALGSTANHAVLTQLAGSQVADSQGVNMVGAFVQTGNDLSSRFEHGAAENLRRRTAMANVPSGYFTQHKFYLDGTNILYWDKSRPGSHLRNVTSLARALKAQGADYCVFFDASTPYKLNPREASFYQMMLSHNPNRFVQVPAGTEADAFILMKADQDPQSVVISHDCFRDRASIYPWVKTKGRRVAGLAMDGEILIPEIGLTVPLTDIQM